MSRLTQTQIKYMKKVTNKIKDLPISGYFYDIKNYTDKGRNQMDLSTVLHKLENDDYQKVENWKEDMNKIWKTTTQTQNNQCLILIAKELSILFKELAEEIPKNNIEEWRYKVKKAHKKFIRISEASKPEIERKQNQPGIGRLGSRPRLIPRIPSQSN